MQKRQRGLQAPLFANQISGNWKEITKGRKKSGLVLLFLSAAYTIIDRKQFFFQN